MRFLFVDRILQLSPAQFVRGIKHITRYDPYLCLDNQGKLCFAPIVERPGYGQSPGLSISLN